jgi:hypothetical protein
MAIWPMDGVVSPPLNVLRAALLAALIAAALPADAQTALAQIPAAQSANAWAGPLRENRPPAENGLPAGQHVRHAPGFVEPPAHRPLTVQHLGDKSLAARFARERAEEPLYVLTPPQWDANANWYDAHQSLAASAFQEAEAEPLKHPSTAPSSLWQRWRDRRLEIRRQPGTWTRYPFYFEKFTGLAHLDEPVHGQINNGQGNLFGGRLGWDIAKYAGIETRLGYVRATLNDTAHPLIPSHENFLFWDANFLVYPFGDRRWRPFGMVGMGLADVGFIDDMGRTWHQTLITLPVAVGVKYRVNNLTALRLDVTDNIVFGTAEGGNGRHTMSNIAVFFAFERRFGLPHRSYFNHADIGTWSRLRNWFSSMEH